MPTAAVRPAGSSLESSLACAASDVRSIVSSLREWAVALRRDLHAHPEMNFQERRTSSVVARELRALGIEHRAGLAGGTGVLGYLPSTGDAGRAKTVALRADMDALAIAENTGKAYASTVPGVMHACGHDGHTAMLLGAARALSSLRERPNNTLLVFQPAEEFGAGGEKMCEEGCLSGKVLGRAADAVYGLHGWPDLELGCVATRDGPLLAATDEFTLTIHGKGGHAAYPHMCIDPIVASAHVITAAQSIVSRRFNPLDPAVITFGSIKAGEANNVIPHSAVLTGTIRTLKPALRSFIEAEFRRVVASVCEGLGARPELEWHPGYPVTENDPGATARFRAIARRALGAERVIEREHPTMGGEDFSFYGRYAPACFFFLGLRPAGAESCAGLHTPEFDFNDDALPVGIEMLARLAAEPL